MHLNIQSISSKFPHLCNFLQTLSRANIRPDIFTLQETWSVHEKSFDIIGYNFFFKARKSGRGGGVGVYVKDCYPAKYLEKASFFVENILESLALEIEIPGSKKFVAVSLYRPNCHKTLTKAEQSDLFIHHFKSQLEYLSSLHMPIYFFTDSNINLFNYGLDQRVNEYLDHLLLKGYLQIITKATRIGSDSVSLIDHIFTNDNIRNISSGVLVDSFSDHFITFCSLNFDKGKGTNSKPNFKRSFNRESKAGFKGALRNQLWGNVFESNCPNTAFNNFSDTYQTLFDSYFPYIRVKANKNCQPINKFMTKGLLLSRKTKLKLARKAKKSPNQININNFRVYRNLYNKVLHTSKKLYFQSKIAGAGKNSRRVWQTINEATNNLSNRGSINCIRANDLLISDEQSIANCFNDFFANIGPKTSDKAKPTNSHFSEFLPPPSLNSFFMNPIDANEIISAVKNMEKKVSLDVNDLSIKFISEHIDEVALPLSHIFNASIETGLFPSKMKTSKTVPVYKNVNSPLDPSNYRPISIIDAWSKIFEKIVSAQLLRFLFSNDFFYSNQFGFLKTRSTEQAILQIINYVTKSLDNGNIAAACLLDVQKAFDTVDHNILLSKLENAGIRGIPLKWFKSYLLDRKQRVLVGSTFSDSTADIKIGVIQGSILGVLLFLVYINDIHNASDVLYSVLFADDITSLASAADFQLLQNLLNIEMHKLCTWYRANKMVVHPMKS